MKKVLLFMFLMMALSTQAQQKEISHIEICAESCLGNKSILTA